MHTTSPIALKHKFLERKMISKSTKAKRRQNSVFYEAVAKIQVDLVDARLGRRFYIVSYPATPSRSIHLEAYGTRTMIEKYRGLLTQLRGANQMERAQAR